MRGMWLLCRGLRLCGTRRTVKRDSRARMCTASDEHQPTFGLLFDIDGVLVRGKTPIPAARKAFQKLVNNHGQFLVPVVFVTNAGNCLRQTKADQLSNILGVPPSTAVDLPKIDAVILFGEPIRWETNLQIITDVLLTEGHPASPHRLSSYPHIPLLACNMDLMWMAEARSPRFGHGMFMVCLESIYKKITGKELKYEALMGKPSEVTYHYAEYLIRTKAAEMQWNKPVQTLYAVGDNLMTDIYGANHYNRYLQERNSRKGSKTLVQTGSGARVTTVSQDVEAAWESELSCPSATHCKSVLVCTGIYNPHAEVPADPTQSVTETVFHGHRDFRIDPALVEPGHVVPDVNAAVDLIFQLEKFLPSSDNGTS